MPFEVFALPAIICFIIGVINGLKAMDNKEEEEYN
jgi:hypothetical protein